MFKSITSSLKKVFGTKYDRDVNNYMPIVEEINEIFETLKDLSNDELRNKTNEFRERIAEYLSNIGNNAIWKNQWQAAGGEIIWNMVHYDVQLIGGMVLHDGKIARWQPGKVKPWWLPYPLT
jgi:preprotein translocase subunit SecA